MAKILDEYFNLHKKYGEKYGESNTIIFMQIGSFFEMFSTNDYGPNIWNISSITNMAVGEKTTFKIPGTKKSPYMLGFPMTSAVKFINMLTNKGYVIVIVEQDPGDSTKREVSNIYTTGTNIEAANEPFNKYMVNLFWQEETLLSGEKVLCGGFTAIDTTTGECIVHEAYSEKEDYNLALDEAVRFISSLSPQEIVISSDIKSFSIDYIINYLELDSSNVHKKDNIDKKYFQISFHNQFLNDVFGNFSSMVSPIEQLGIEKNIYLIISLVYLLDFIRDLNGILIKDLNYPQFYLDNRKLILGNNAIKQLSIIPTNDANYYQGQKVKSLIDVIDYTKTSIGKRYLKSRLISPYVNQKDIINSHNQIEYILKKPVRVDNFMKILKKIGDVERYQRRMVINKIYPMQMAGFIESYEHFYQLSKKLNNKTGDKLFGIKKVKKELDNFLDEIDKIFDKELLASSSANNMKTPFFKKGVYPDLDNTYEKYQETLQFNDHLSDKLNNFLSNKKKGQIKIKSTEKQGYFVSLTSNQREIIQNKASKFTIGEQTINPKEFKYLTVNNNTNNIKLFIPQLNNNSNEIIRLEEKLDNDIRQTFLFEINKIYKKYKNFFNSINHLIAIIDYATSGAYVANNLGYYKPKIEDGESGNVNGIEIRHPIVEKLIEYPYVPHDISLGNNHTLNGMLIYGLNSAGKSVLMKAVGLNVILAQAGYYVAAKSFTLTPYHSIYTRITGDDNIFRGLSSFSLEMTELNSIIKRADEYTMVIGDEVCRGTEIVSGNSIVASTILHLAKVNSSFIFATHLHHIVELKEISELNNVKPFHIAVSYDNENETIIYDRKLKEGVGDKVYGILVAKHIIQNKSFIDKALDFKNQLIENDRISRYNRNYYLYKCYVCNNETKTLKNLNLETHHLKPQKNCVNGLVENNPHLKKDSTSNIISICQKCHNYLHEKGISIEKIMTSKGCKLIESNK